jgi:phage tail sheath protein FI
MPEYLAPGVYVEEVSYRSKSIEGVSTTTTGFVGPARYGPLAEEPDVVTSLIEFERTYGDGQRLAFADLDPMDNFMWHAARSFFEQGGRRLYVQRIFRARADDEGFAEATLPAAGGDAAEIVRIRARFPGAAGAARVRVGLQLGGNALVSDPEGQRRLNGVLDRDIVFVSEGASPPGSVGEFFRAARTLSETGEETWQFVRPGQTIPLDELAVHDDPTLNDVVRVLTATVTVTPLAPDALSLVWEGLSLDPQHERAGVADSLAAKFAARPENAAAARTLPIVVEQGGDVDGLGLLDLLFDASSDARVNLLDPESAETESFVELVLAGGDDGVRPTAEEYEEGLRALEGIEDVSIVAAPGSTFAYENGYRADGATIMQHLIGHAERTRYRIAVLDSANGQSIADARRMRATVDSRHAAFYYPWIRVLDPITQQEIHLPPSGFVAGIYARNDTERAVYKAPANEVVTGAIGFETMLNRSQQEVLNPEGINCFRFFEGRGYRLWGARTISSDPEWKYVNLRRYFAYLERSIDRGTQWAVFEPNGERLWANVRRTVEDFLFNEWQSGALLGDKPEKAFFVKCDRSTMTQNDLDNGRLVCLVGVAPLRPAEFVIFRIGQWTADRKV